ncbi:MAG: DUF4905 domain-containing protein [Bacteroidota bacterium]
MTLQPHISEKFNGIVWRMEIDPISATLFAEIRNEAEKQVSFASINLQSGKVNFTQLTADERWLTGMEAAYDGILLLHNYQSPGSPAHKGLIAIDGESGQVLWSDYNHTFNHLSINGPVVFDSRIQPRKLFTTDIKTGAMLHTYNPIIDEDVDAGIILPDIIPPGDLDAATLPEQPFGNIVHNLYYNDYRIVSLHALKSNTLSQHLYIFKHDQQVFNDLLNTGIQKLQPEAFVLHNKHLIYLKDKAKLVAIDLEN